MQFKDGLELSVTSGNIRQEILAENARHFLNFEYDEDMNQLDVARHPDNIYYIYLDTNIEIVTYSMIRLLHH